MKIKKAILFLGLGIILLAGCGRPALYKDTQIMMGTTVEVVSPTPEAAKIAFAEIRRIEGLLSIYKDDSEVTLLNRKGELRVSAETFYVLKKAVEFWQSSNGAFDITIAPLMDLWGFSSKSYRLPSQAEIRKTLEYVGSDKIIFNDKNNVVKFKVLGTRIDLGAIAKGFAVDCAVKKLKEQGITSCLINAGGDIYCLGDKSGRPWKIAIQDPRQSGFLGYLKLKDRAVATSGNYRQFFTKGDKRYAHILDPKSGYPAESRVSSVSVLAPDCLTADAVATAAYVLGKNQALKFTAKFKGVELTAVTAIDK